MKIRVLNAPLVRELLPMERCIALMRQAMSMVTRQETVQPIRQGLRPPDVHGLIGLMPGYTSTPQWLGVKVVTVFEGNFGTQFGSHQGMVLLFEAKHGTPKAIIDASEITAIRTAAATAVATDVLAREDAASLGIFGYGEQAHQHLAALRLVRNFQRVLVWGRDAAKARAFAAEQSAHLGIDVEAVARPELAAEADVICTLTSARDPFYRGEWLRPGQHLNLVGASMPTTAEADPDVVRRSRYFGDFKDSTLALAGEFHRAKQAGLVNDDHLLGSIGDILEGRIAGRTSREDITTFKSLGMIVEDLISADHVLAEAERRDVGSVIDW